MATITGARALHMDSMIGSIETGKRADVIMIRLNEPHAVPMYNVYSQLVYALKASDVSDVMVNGRVIVRDKKITCHRSRARCWRKRPSIRRESKKSLAH